LEALRVAEHEFSTQPQSPQPVPAWINPGAFLEYLPRLYERDQRFTPYQLVMAIEELHEEIREIPSLITHCVEGFDRWLRQSSVRRMPPGLAWADFSSDSSILQAQVVARARVAAAATAVAQLNQTTIINLPGSVGMPAAAETVEPHQEPAAASPMPEANSAQSPAQQPLQDAKDADLDACIAALAAEEGGKTDRITIRTKGPAWLRVNRSVEAYANALENRFQEQIHADKRWPHGVRKDYRTSGG
jgi:hypothetical protein